MSVSRLPNNRWRAQVAHEGKNLSVPSIIGGERSYRTKSEAKAARAKAREALGKTQVSSVTVRGFWERWTTDPLFARPKLSTAIHNRERTKAFVERYGSVPLERVDGGLVGEWLAGGKRNGTVPALRAMFYDALSAELVQSNPFARRGVARGRGRRDQEPPSEEMVWSLIGHAKALSGDHYGAWLQVAAFTGMRPGELDALRWDRVDFKRSRIMVVEQFSANSRTFTSPKNGRRREAPLTKPARDVLVGLARQGEFCFVNLHNEHFTASSRAYHWKGVKAAAGYDGSLYLCTRHFAASYMVNTLGMAPEDVAIALGHEDGGELIRRLYGHLDKDKALDRVVAAYEQGGQVRPLRLIEGESA